MALMAVESDDEAGLGDTERGEWTLRDEDARRYVQRAVDATVSLVESTFGPNGMEKLIETADSQNRNEIVQVDDGGRILDAIERGDGFSHPVAALFVDGVEGMRAGLHDGTTTTVLLTGALMQEGTALIDRGLAPSDVLVGYGIARARAGKVLDGLAQPVDTADGDRLTAVAETTMTTALPAQVRSELARAVAATVSKLARTGDTDRIDTDQIKVLAQPEATTDVYEGLIVTRPARAEPNGRGPTEPLTDVRVAILDREIDPEETASVLDGGNGVKLSSPGAANRYQTELEARVETVAADLRDRGVGVLVCSAKLDEWIVRSFEAAGIAVVDKATYPKEDVYRLGRALGGTAVSNLRDLTDDRLGTAERVEQHWVCDNVWTLFGSDSGGTYTIVAGGETDSGAARREAAVEDALEATTVAALDEQVLPGAGAPAVAVGNALRDEATELEGQEQLAMTAFADALDRIPVVLARNVGRDPSLALTELRTAHAADGRTDAGLGRADGAVISAWDAGVIEPRRVFSQAIETAAAVTERLLTVDSVLFPGVTLEGYTPKPERD